PTPSMAVQVTVVTPLANVEPLVGLHELVTLVQLSVELNVHVTLLLVQRPPSAMPTMFVEQVTIGFSVSFTVTVKLQGAPGLPELSVTVQLTLVVPLLNTEPE